MSAHHVSKLGFLVMIGLAATFARGQAGEKPRRPVIVNIQDEKPVVAELELPVDPTERIRLQMSGISPQIRNEANQNLHLSHFPVFLIDGQMVNPNNIPGGLKLTQGQLPNSPGGRPRRGYTLQFAQGDLRITQTAEIVPSKGPPGQKRRLDTVLVRYVIENKGMRPHKVGVRNYIDMYVIDNDGAQFAAPTLPGKLLDGIELKDKTLPEYVQALQKPDLKDPGFVAHLTLKLGGGIEKANRVVLTRHGLGFNAWDMPAMPGTDDSALGIFWDPRDIPPEGKREVGYAYGQGIAIASGREGPFHVALTGSFEPGKVFTIAATVADPIPGQSLTLELPPGMDLMEGREIQPVPPLLAERPQSLVVWKARVLRTGEFHVHISSSTGVTQTKIVSISEP